MNFSWKPKPKYNYYFNINLNNHTYILPTKKLKSKHVYGHASKNKKSSVRDFIKLCYKEIADINDGSARYYRGDTDKVFLLEIISKIENQYLDKYPEAFI